MAWRPSTGPHRRATRRSQSCFWRPTRTRISAKMMAWRPSTGPQRAHRKRRRHHIQALLLSLCAPEAAAPTHPPLEIVTMFEALENIGSLHDILAENFPKLLEVLTSDVPQEHPLFNLLRPLPDDSHTLQLAARRSFTRKRQAIFTRKDQGQALEMGPLREYFLTKISAYDQTTDMPTVEWADNDEESAGEKSAGEKSVGEKSVGPLAVSSALELVTAFEAVEIIGFLHDIIGENPPKLLEVFTSKVPEEHALRNLLRPLPDNSHKVKARNRQAIFTGKDEVRVNIPSDLYL